MLQIKQLYIFQIKIKSIRRLKITGFSLKDGLLCAEIQPFSMQKACF